MIEIPWYLFWIAITIGVILGVLIGRGNRKAQDEVIRQQKLAIRLLLDDSPEYDNFRSLWKESYRKNPDSTEFGSF